MLLLDIERNANAAAELELLAVGHHAPSLHRELFGKLLADDVDETGDADESIDFFAVENAVYLNTEVAIDLRSGECHECRVFKFRR